MTGVEGHERSDDRPGETILVYQLDRRGGLDCAAGDLVWTWGAVLGVMECVGCGVESGDWAMVAMPTAAVWIGGHDDIVCDEEHHDGQGQG